MPIENMITTPPEALGWRGAAKRSSTPVKAGVAHALIDTEETMSAEDAAALDDLEPGAA
jgi:hypothetical protein